MDLSWMAWTWPTAAFFGTILFFLVCMTLWEVARPGGGPRIGILRIETTRGDRLFITLLGSAFIHLAWLGLLDTEVYQLYWALVVSAVYGLAVFRWV